MEAQAEAKVETKPNGATIVSEQEAGDNANLSKPVPKPEQKVTFFAEDDLTKEGRILSQYPAWYFTTHIEELEEEIRHDEFVIERELVDKANRFEFKENLKKKKEKLARIQESTPRLNTRQIQKLDGYHHELSERLRDSMFSYTEMQRGTADAHEEARRMSMPCIDVPKDLAMLCNVRLQNGQATRNQAAKCWKIVGRILGKNTNVETLRKG